MAGDETGFELIKLLDLPEGTPLDERLWRWALAFDAWLEERRTNYGRTTGYTSYQSWRDFLDLARKAPWEVSAADVDAYVQSLEAKGLRPRTISKLIIELGSFYTYCQETGVDFFCGPGFNPVKEARRPKAADYENVRYLSEKEENALLEAIQRDDLPISKRDYALILTLLRTGWKAGKVRQLTWGELRRGDGETGRVGDGEIGSAAALTGDGERRCPYGGRGEGVPEEVGEAIREYLEASGRLEGIRDEEYVFAPVRNRWVSERFDGGEDWDGSRPLSQNQLNRLVKQHAQAAGLRAKAITCHTLRHTAAMRYLKTGQSAEAVGAYLGRTGGRGIRHYVRSLEKSPKGRLKARSRKTSGQKRLPSRQMRRFQPGNQMRLTHGLRARRLPEFEWLKEQGIRLKPADAAVLRWRIVIMRALILWEHIETVEEACLVLKAVGQASANLARAIKDRGKIRALARELGLEGELLEGWGEDEF